MGYYESSYGSAAIEVKRMSRFEPNPAISKDHHRLGLSTNCDPEKLHFKYREKLPVGAIYRIADKNKNLNISSILKNYDKEDINKRMLFDRVHIHEPLSRLQRLAEYMEYHDLVEKATTMDSAESRMEYVCTFVISTQSSSYKRLRKPFDSFLGETYEYVRPDLGFRFVAEQVSQDPPISAFHAEGRGYSFWGNVRENVKVSASGLVVDMTPLVSAYLYLNKQKETYSWQHCQSSIKNILLDQVWLLENEGVVGVNCPETGIRGVVTFKNDDKLAARHLVGCLIYDGVTVKRALYGNWINGVYSSGMTSIVMQMLLPERSKEKPAESLPFMKKAAPGKKTNRRSLSPTNTWTSNATTAFEFEMPDQTLLWSPAPRSKSCGDYYMMTDFAMKLNQLLPRHQTILPPTDSRFREDIRLFENGNIAKAGEATIRLQEKQAEERGKRGRKEHVPMCFLPSDTGDIQNWEFTHEYWKRNTLWDTHWGDTLGEGRTIVEVMFEELRKMYFCDTYDSYV